MPEKTELGPEASRRTLLAGATAFGGILLAGQASRVLADTMPAQTIRLVPQVAERALPERILGFNSPGTYIPYEAPGFVPALKAVGPQVLRFPGGTVGNYYNWRTGTMEVPDAGPQNGVYRKFLLTQAVPGVKQMHPNGVWLEQWESIADAVGANLVIMANLETSTAQDQAAWFAGMKRKGIPANLVEMGTEFFIAMFDAPGRARFPDPEFTTKLTKTFVDAIRPQLSPGAKVSVQSSAATFEMREPPAPGADITKRRIWAWDQALKAEPWFDAVTIHLYPTETGSAGIDLVKQLPASADRVFSAMMGRADSGFDRVIRDVVGRAPGKEIWITEYGGFDPGQTFYGLKLPFNGFWLHQVTRELFSILRHPEVTIACYHAALAQGNLMSTFSDDGKFTPINAECVHSWFFHASRGPGCTWQSMTIEGAKRLSSDSVVPGESYSDVEAGLFRKGTEHTLFVHNASPVARKLDLSRVAPASRLTAETIATPDLLASYNAATPVPQPLQTQPALEVPGYSLTRVTWSA